MADYTAIIATAHRLLQKFGEESTLVRTVNGVPSDPTKPWIPGTAVVTTYLVHSVWLNESILRRESLVKQGEVFALLAALDLTAVVPDPSTDHLVRADGRRFAIVECRPLDPSGQAIIYEARARS